jgi:hypothetical protein
MVYNIKIPQRQVVKIFVPSIKRDRKSYYGLVSLSISPLSARPIDCLLEI